MPQVYESPIGASPNTGAPMGSLLGSHMPPIPIPSITGGAAAPSGANGGRIGTTVFSTAGGNGLWYAMAAVILGVIWLKKK